MTIVVVEDRWGLRGGTKANLATVDPIPLVREAMIETDTGRIKVGTGTGTDHLSDLQYINLGFIDFSGISNGDVPTWDAANSRFKLAAPPVGGGGSAFNPKTGTYLCEDFWQGVKTSSSTGTNFENVAGAVVYTQLGATATITRAIGRPRQVLLSTGTNASSWARMFVTGTPGITPGGGVIRGGTFINIPSLSTSAQSFYVIFGFFDSISGAPSDRIDFSCIDSANGGQWVLSAWASGVLTSVNSAIAPVAGAETLVELEINAAGTSVTAYVDGVAACTLGISITAALSVGVLLNKAAGAIVRTLIVNYVEVGQTFTIPRG